LASIIGHSWIEHIRLDGLLVCVCHFIYWFFLLMKVFEKDKERSEGAIYKIYFYLNDAIVLHLKFLYLTILPFESRAFLCKKHSSQWFSL